MKQIAQNYKSGELAVLEVPPPTCAPGGVLVRTLYSLISTGTELMKVNESKMSLLGKARARPEQVKKVVEAISQQGLMSAYRKVSDRLDSYTPLGYSLAGLVEQVGPGAESFSIGQLVACAGNEFAVHAELNWVPVNLCVAVPEVVAPQFASFATVGAIALQGVRQGKPQLGDTACVIGLGLVGQLVVQLLVASGVKVVGVDFVQDRCRLAEKMGAILCAAPDEPGLSALETTLQATSGGFGADQIYLAAGGPSTGPVEAAARLARDRATVVDIGKTKLSLPWNAYYEKELELRFSRSYGPGRYDPTYEIAGIDYPYGYVRWTEQRNLACFLDLVASGDIDISPLVSGTFPLDQAVDVYDKLRSGTLEGVGFLFEYPTEKGGEGRNDSPRPASKALVVADRTSNHATNIRSTTRPVRVGFIGAGNYACSMLLPHLRGNSQVELAHVVTRHSLTALNAQKKFHFESAGTDPGALFDNDSIDAIFVATRHSSHASLTCRALETGKSVFVEKPLALSMEELDRIIETIDATGNDKLMVGFNRRFSPLLVESRSLVGPKHGPAVARYLVNAGVLGSDSWYRDESAEGTRFVGEGGHFIDTVSWWLGAEPVEVMAVCSTAGQDLQVLLRYDDGSIASITYLTNGHRRFPKEHFDYSNSGVTARIENFKRATVWKGHRHKTKHVFGTLDKGQEAELDAFVDAVRAHKPMPIPLESLVKTTRATLLVTASLTTGRPVSV